MIDLDWCAMKLEFYEKVRVMDCPDFPALIGKLGYVLGKSYVDDDPDRGEVTGYSVHFEDLGESYSFSPHELVGSGEIAERSRFYSGEAIRVKVVNGKGYLADD